MRAKEFLIDQIINDSQAVLEDINGNINYCHYIELIDSELSESSLFEQLSSDDVDYIKSLKSYSAIPKIGEYYAPVMAFLLPNDLKFFGDKQPLQLTRIRNDSGVEVYDFVDDAGKVKTYPDARLTEKSYAELFLFNDAQVYLKFKLAITLKFKDATLPNITFGKSVNEIAKIPQGDYGQEGTIDWRVPDVERKELPGGRGFTYGINKENDLLEIMIFDQDKIVGELDLFNTGDVMKTWGVENVAVDPAHRGRGIAKALYGIALSILKLPVEAGQIQTRHGQHMWLMLNSIPGVEVVGYNQEPTGKYQARKGDKIISQDNKYTRYTFPVKAGVNSMRSLRPGTGIYTSASTSMIAKWTGQ